MSVAAPERDEAGRGPPRRVPRDAAGLPGPVGVAATLAGIQAGPGVRAAGLVDGELVPRLRVGDDRVAVDLRRLGHLAGAVADGQAVRAENGDGALGVVLRRDEAGLDVRR